mgnify:CR=1 FL=1
MSHYAKVRQGKVVDVIVASDSYMSNLVDTTPGKWIKTSYNMRGGSYYEPNHASKASDQSVVNADEGRKRKNYAGVGYHYDTTKDVFYPPQPFNSWSLNTTTYQWEAPKTMPDDNKLYTWNESKEDWEEVK